MKISTKIFLSFGAIALAVVFSNTYLAQTLTHKTQETILGREKLMIAKLVQIQAENHLSAADFTVPDNPARQNRFKKLFQEIKIDEIIRIKVWDASGTIIYSDAKDIVGQRFLANKHWLAAMRGALVADIKAPIDPEHRTEQNYKQLMELYIPISFNGKVVGVIETYSNLESLNAAVADARRTIHRVIDLSLLAILLVALIVMVIIRRTIAQPALALCKATRQVTEGNYEVELGKIRHDEIGQLASDFQQMVDELQASKIRLAATESRFATIFEKAADSIIIYGLNGKILEVNQAACELFQKSKSQMLDSTIFEIYSPEEQKLTADKIQLIRKKGHLVFERQLKVKDDRPIDIEVNANVIEYLDLPAILSISRDITSHKFVEVELETKVIERTQTLKEANLKLEHNVHIQSAISQILQISMTTISFDEQLERILKHLLFLPWFNIEAKGAIFIYDKVKNKLQMKTQQGLSDYLLDNCAYVEIGSCLCGEAAQSKQIVFTDDLDNRHLHYEGITAHGHYCVPILSEDTLLGVLTLYLKAGHVWKQEEVDFLKIVAHTIAMIIERSQTELMKEQFLQTVSHELRTPLTSIIGYQDILLSGLQGSLSEDQQKTLRIALNNSELLLALVNDLLELNRLEAGEMPVKISPIKIVAEAEEVLNSVYVSAENKGIIVRTSAELDPDYEINTDGNKIKTIMRNLVGNAVKFTETGEVCLGLTLQDSNLYITVSDTGIGIPFEDHEHIFNKFSQVDNSISRKFDGTGLGLAIVKKTTELLGGSITLQSELGVGSQFKVEIPL